MHDTDIIVGCAWIFGKAELCLCTLTAKSLFGEAGSPDRHLEPR